MKSSYDSRTLSLETHYRQKAELTEKQLVRPIGNAFSNGGYEASAACMLSFSELIATALKEIV
jgi:hypothetical protein